LREVGQCWDTFVIGRCEFGDETKYSTAVVRHRGQGRDDIQQIDTVSDDVDDVDDVEHT
jgi:hypothetical protein